MSTLLLMASANICSDFVLASILSIVKRILDLVQLVVPIILIVSGSLQLAKLMLNPDNDKKGLKAVTNSFMAALIVFFLPAIITLTMNVINESGEAGITDDSNLTVLNLSSCWTAANYTQAEMDSVREGGGSNSSTISDEYTKVKIIDDTEIKAPEHSGSSNQNLNPQNTPMGLDVVNYARQFVGNPYVYGGESLTNGIDCSAYIQQIYGHFGVSLPRQSSEFRTVGTEVPNINEARAGDIICYSGHVALFVGDGLKILHAKGKDYGIVETDNALYKSVITIRRVIN